MRGFHKHRCELESLPFRKVLCGLHLLFALFSAGDKPANNLRTSLHTFGTAPLSWVVPRFLLECRMRRVWPSGHSPQNSAHRAPCTTHEQAQSTEAKLAATSITLMNRLVVKM